jgi:hypothetical protein
MSILSATVNPVIVILSSRVPPVSVTPAISTGHQ